MNPAETDADSEPSSGTFPRSVPVTTDTSLLRDLVDEARPLLSGLLSQAHACRAGVTPDEQVLLNIALTFGALIEEAGVLVATLDHSAVPEVQP